MQFYAYHGVFAEENKLGQSYIVDVEAYLDLSAAGQSDRLEDTIDYSLIYQLVQGIMARKVYRLVEAVAEDIAGQILDTFEQVQAVKVKVTKPTPPIPGHYAGVAVEIKRNRDAGGDTS
ncbi:dihydroneopterin aldolase [Caldalkalibacillus uzonensis]|uniref:7,8-dihydroneopterin aldolase n=2 Tax=Caldalkalibacillus uzonensis TaxID=353224 RepID=A0ABU0CXQ1_9BACI|nr:dihydroneopterin aldolase [Caldalkalibacillus uzonensis]